MKKFKGLICLGFLTLASGFSQAQTVSGCVQLGWSGGTAGNEVKWVQAMATITGRNNHVNDLHLTYNHKNGSIDAAIDLEFGIMEGSWKQDGSNGGLDFKSVDNEIKISSLYGLEGYWWSEGSPDVHSMPEGTPYNFFMKKCTNVKQ